MGLFDKVKYYFFTIKENKRYKKIKSCNLPFPFFSKSAPSIEWVRYSRNYRRYCADYKFILFYWRNNKNWCYISL